MWCLILNDILEINCTQRVFSLIKLDTFSLHNAKGNLV